MVVAPNNNREITVDEIEAANSTEKLWIIIHGNVYDVTEFKIEHPGGPDVLINTAGEDASQDFEDMMHSLHAREMLEEFHIGRVKGMEVKDPIEVYHEMNKARTAKSPPSSTSTWIYIVPLVVGIAYYYYQSWV